MSTYNAYLLINNCIFMFILKLEIFRSNVIYTHKNIFHSYLENGDINTYINHYIIL